MPRIESYTAKTSLADADNLVLADSADLDANSRHTTKKLAGSVINAQFTTVTANIATNVSDISDNTTDIATNTSAIAGLGAGLVVTKTAGYTILDGDNVEVIYCNFSADGTITMPTLTANDERRVRIYNVSSGGWVVTIDGEGAETINTQTTVKLVSQFDYIDLIGDDSTSSTWVVEDHAISFTTGWINRSDWTSVGIGSSTTKDVDSNCNHKMNATIGELRCQMMINSSASDTACWIVNGPANTANDRGCTVHSVDADNCKFFTGVLGIPFVNTGGSATNMSSEDWYYKLAISREVIL